MLNHASIRPLRFAEIDDIASLAKLIWREHHTKFITDAQIEYMLSGKYTLEDLQPFIGASDRWFDVLRVDGAICGFLRCIQTSSHQLKLSEVYVSRTQRGRGFGRLLLARAESLGKDVGCKSIFLYVNRRNDVPIAAYKRAGFASKGEQVFDIGGGFVMEDFLMEKLLHEGQAEVSR
jgi:ribosomal protein S18 acetylase RimI-like enzyme